MLSKIRMEFEGLSDKRYNELDKELRDDLAKYRRMRRDVLKFEKEIEKCRERIKELQLKSKKYNRRLIELYDSIKFLKDDFIPIVGIVGYEKSGDVYWNVNVKFRKNNKSYYLGSDSKVREVLYKKVGVGLKVKKETIYPSLSSTDLISCPAFETTIEQIIHHSIVIDQINCFKVRFGAASEYTGRKYTKNSMKLYF